MRRYNLAEHTKLKALRESQRTEKNLSADHLQQSVIYSKNFPSSSLRGSALKSVAWLAAATFFSLACPLVIDTTPSYAADIINLSTIKQIESSGNPLAYNSKTKAIGWYQITPICLKDYNQFHTSKIEQSELFNPTKNEMVARWYFSVRIPQLLKHYKQSQSIENILTAYNAGIKSVISKRQPIETAEYIRKYKRGQRGEICQR